MSDPDRSTSGQRSSSLNEKNKKEKRRTHPRSTQEARLAEGRRRSQVTDRFVELVRSHMFHRK